MIEYFIGTEGVTFDIDSPVELYQALDILHSQVMFNTPKQNQEELLPILEEAMLKMDKLGYDLEGNL